MALEATKLNLDGEYNLQIIMDKDEIPRTLWELLYFWKAEFIGRDL